MIEIEEALNTSQKGARLAAQTPSWQRREWLNSVANEIQSAKQQLAELIVAEGVKTIREADVEVSRAAATFALSAEEVGRHAGKVIALDRMRGGTGRLGHYLRRPIGVVLGITPFNDPLNLVAHKLAPAIAAGNSVILKPHYKTPSVAIRLRELCIAAGIPPDVVTVVHCDNDTTKSLARDQRIGMVSFTGGKLGGAAIARASAGKPISLELGGVSSTIVLEDANLSDAIPLIVSGMFAAAGQNCLHVQRILVAEQLYHEALTDLVQKNPNAAPRRPDGLRH